MGPMGAVSASGGLELRHDAGGVPNLHVGRMEAVGATWRNPERTVTAAPRLGGAVVDFAVIHKDTARALAACTSGDMYGQHVPVVMLEGSAPAPTCALPTLPRATTQGSDLVAGHLTHSHTLHSLIASSL